MAPLNGINRICGSTFVNTNKTSSAGEGFKSSFFTPKAIDNNKGLVIERSVPSCGADPQSVRRIAASMKDFEKAYAGNMKAVKDALPNQKISGSTLEKLALAATIAS